MQKAAGSIEAAVGKAVHSSTLQAKGEELHQKGFDQIEAAKRHHLPEGVLGEDKVNQKAAISGTHLLHISAHKQFHSYQHARSINKLFKCLKQLCSTSMLDR
jgi:hypothetical protein